MGKREELEAKLIENPKDTELRLVYADLLQSTGDPRGELIVLQQRGKSGDDYIEKHADVLLGPLTRFAKTFDHEPKDAFTWHLGFIKSAVLGYENNYAGDLDEDDEECTADKVAAALLQHPSALLLEELTVTMNMLDDGMYFDDVCKAIGQYRAPALRKLHLGEFQHAGPGGVQNGYDYEISWSSLGDASTLWAAVPRLETLRIQLGLGGSSASGGGDSVGTFDLPKLEHLEVITGGMSAECARSFASGKLPAIELMELWFGSHNYGGNTKIDDLAPLLAGTNVPALKMLGLMNAEFTDELIEPLAKSPVLAKIKALSLAHGMMTDAGAATLVKHADAFKHLSRLDISDNYVTGDALASLRSALPATVSDKQREGDDYRYVSLAE